MLTLGASHDGLDLGRSGRRESERLPKGQAGKAGEDKVSGKIQ